MHDLSQVKAGRSISLARSIAHFLASYTGDRKFSHTKSQSKTNTSRQKSQGPPSADKRHKRQRGGEVEDTEGIEI